MYLRFAFKICTLYFFVFITLPYSYSQVGFPYFEDFQGNSAQACTIFGGQAELIDGVLRLTEPKEFQTGFVYIDIPFSSVYGIKASFEFFVYGGGIGADGLSVFLFDADVPNFSIGGFGGSLGYAQRGNETGVSAAYLGLGIDAWGNFGNSGEGKNWWI
jgi:hypothetical protein